MEAGVAQLVEQRIRNAKVGSSILFSGTTFKKGSPGGKGKASFFVACMFRKRKKSPHRFNRAGSCNLVEAAGVEPASGNLFPMVLHA